MVSRLMKGVFNDRHNRDNQTDSSPINMEDSPAFSLNLPILLCRSYLNWTSRGVITVLKV